MTGSVAIACANSGASVAWVVPIYKNARPVWRFAERIVKPVSDKLQVNKTEKTIDFPSGGSMGVYSADNPVGILGEAFDLVIVEEAARIAPDIWSETIIPTLADRDGNAMLISTPRGRNWFWKEFQRGLGDGKVQASFTAPSSDNPMPSIRKAFAMARARISERTFRQEWLAEFVEDGGGVFRNVRALSTLTRIEPIAGRSYLVGVDWARTNDASVFSVWDVAARQEVVLDRMTDTNYSLQITRLKALTTRYNARVIAESNGLGDPLIEQAQRAGIPISPFYTSNVTKAHIIDDLALACEQNDVRFQSDENGIFEMEAFESSRTATGLVKYSAPDGMHDDIVMARAIAYSGLNIESLPDIQTEQTSKWNEADSDGTGRTKSRWK